MGRPRFYGHTRWDDPLSEPDEADVDVDLLPYDETDPNYLERRRQAQIQHYRQQLGREERRGATSTAALWRRLLAELEITEHWSSGAGDRILF